MSKLIPPQDPNDNNNDENQPQEPNNDNSNKDQPKHLPPDKAAQDDFLFSLIDLGNSISEVRGTLMSNLKLLENDVVQQYIIKLIYPELMYYLGFKIGFYNGKLSVAKEEVAKKQSPKMYAWLEAQIEKDTYNKDIYRIIRYFVYRIKKGKSQDILEKIKIPAKMPDFIKYNTNFNVLILIEVINAFSMAFKNVETDDEHVQEVLENILFPKAKIGMINALPKMDEIVKLQAAQEDIRLYRSSEINDIIEKFMEDLETNLNEPYSDLRFAIGFRQTAIINLHDFLEFQEEQYKNNKTNFCNFAELAIKQYKKYINKDQRKVAKKWIKRRCSEAAKSPPKIKRQAEIISPKDKTKLQWQGDLKHLINFFLSLRELNRLNATNSDIMGFIHLHFVDRFSKSYDLEKLKNYLGEDIEPVNKAIMKWFGRPSDLGYVWVNLYNPKTPNRKHLFVHKPEKETVYKILMQSFTKGDGSKLSKEALKKYLNPNFKSHKKADDSLDVRQLMKIGS